MTKRGLRAFPAVLAAALALAAALVPSAAAQDPGRWLLTGASSIPSRYWQGLTSDPPEANVFFVGIFQGLWRTDRDLRQTAGVEAAIPPDVARAEGYNHIGDPTWNAGEGGRVLLPLECFTPGVGNTCGTGAFGVADPATLAFRYYVKLDPAEIPKAMWAETSPDGSLVWTSSGDDLLAYRSSDIAAANAGPSGPLLHAARRLPGAVPPTGITGPCSKAAGCCSRAPPAGCTRCGRSTPPPAPGGWSSRCRSAASPRGSTRSRRSAERCTG